MYIFCRYTLTNWHTGVCAWARWIGFLAVPNIHDTVCFLSKAWVWEGGSFWPSGIRDRVGVVGGWCVGSCGVGGPMALGWGVRVRRNEFRVFGDCLPGWRILREAGDTWGGGTHCKCHIPIMDPVVVSLGIPFRVIFLLFNDNRRGRRFVFEVDG